MRTILAASIVVLFVAVGASLASDITSGLVGYWDFEDITGNIARDVSGDSNDDGVIHGATSVLGIRGNALSFNGSGDYVDVPHSAELDPNSAITITAWFKAYPFALGTYAWPPIVAKKDASAGYEFNIVQVHESTPSLGGNVYIDGQGSLGPLGPLPPVAEDTWYFAAMAYDSSSSIFTNYLRDLDDPDFITASNSFSGDIVSAFNNLNIGRDPLLTSRLFDGIIDEVRIYDRALSVADLEALYVPEPATLSLLALGCLAMLRRRKSIWKLYIDEETATLACFIGSQVVEQASLPAENGSVASGHCGGKAPPTESDAMSERSLL